MTFSPSLTSQFTDLITYRYLWLVWTWPISLQVYLEEVQDTELGTISCIETDSKPRILAILCPFYRRNLKLHSPTPVALSTPHAQPLRLNCNTVMLSSWSTTTWALKHFRCFSCSYRRLHFGITCSLGRPWQIRCTGWNLRWHTPAQLNLTHYLTLRCLATSGHSLNS